MSRVVEAQPSTVFEIVCDPERQVEIDGSGMLQASPDAKPLTTVGDVFVMEMDREPLGDLPMGKYKAFNTVTRIVPDTLLEWSVGSKERPSYGHVYGWEIAVVDSNRVEVTNYCDWSGMPEKVHDKFPVVPVSMMAKSLDNLIAILDSLNSN